MDLRQDYALMCRQKERRRVEARENQPLKKDIIHVGSRSHA